MNENQILLKVSKRQTGKQVVKTLRKNGFVPGIYYSKNRNPIPFAAEQLSLRPIIFTSQTKIVNLEIEGEANVKECVLKDVTFDPVTDAITHFDLYGIIRGTKMTIEVPIVLKGTAIGAREGGVVQHSLRKVQIQCLPKNLPSSIDIDITKLVIGKTIYLKDISVPDVEFLVPEETVIVSVMPPRVKAEVHGTETQTAEKTGDAVEKTKS